MYTSLEWLACVYSWSNKGDRLTPRAPYLINRSIICTVCTRNPISCSLSLDWVLIQQKPNLVQSFWGHGWICTIFQFLLMIGLSPRKFRSVVRWTQFGDSGDSVFGLSHKSTYPVIGLGHNSTTAGPALRRRLPHGGETERPHRGGSTGVWYSDKKRNVLIGGVLLVSGTQTVRPGHD